MGAVVEKATNYIDDTLIRLRRQYSLDETVSALNKKISELEIELGKANAYIDELEDEKQQISLKNGGQQWFEKYTNLKEHFNILKNQLNSDDKYASISYKNKLLHAQNKRLTKKNADLTTKNNQLSNQIQKLKQ